MEKAKMDLNFAGRTGHFLYYGPVMKFLEFNFTLLFKLSHNHPGWVRAFIKRFNKEGENA